MKTARIIYTLIVILMLSTGSINPQTDPIDLTGSWELMTRNGEVMAKTQIRNISKKYFSEAAYDKYEKEFFGAAVGAYTITEDNRIKEVFLGNTWDSTGIGYVNVFEVVLAGNTLIKTGKVNGRRVNEKWKRLEPKESFELAGAWRISGRVRDGELGEIPDSPRKTLKILSGNRFQWIAYNSSTKQFFGTGGGTYDIKDGIYTEHIEFFSRDSSRVGMNLPFNFEMTDRGWHHSGKGSTGNPVDEYWINVDDQD